MAASSKRPSAEENGLSLVCGLAGQGCVRGAEPCPADDRSRTQRSGGLAERLHHRQPEREDQRGRRSTRLLRRQEDHGPQAARPRRHRRARPRPVRPSCQRAGSRWSPAVARRVARSRSSRRSLPMPANQGPCVATATRIAVEIVRRKPNQIGFAVQPRRWVVELLRLDQPKPSSLERCRSHNRIRDSVPLCRGRHGPRLTRCPTA